jgi:hypothetical protein
MASEPLERARLWAVYFSLRSIEHPPPFLLQAEQHLHRHLREGVSPDPPPPPKGRPSRPSLALVR